MELLLGIAAAWLILSVVLGVTVGRAIRRADTAELAPPRATDSEHDARSERPDEPEPEQRAA